MASVEEGGGEGWDKFNTSNLTHNRTYGRGVFLDGRGAAESFLVGSGCTGAALPKNETLTAGSTDKHSNCIGKTHGSTTKPSNSYIGKRTVRRKPCKFLRENARPGPKTYEFLKESSFLLAGAAPVLTRPRCSLAASSRPWQPQAR